MGPFVKLSNVNLGALRIIILRVLIDSEEAVTLVFVRRGTNCHVIRNLNWLAFVTDVRPCESQSIKLDQVGL